MPFALIALLLLSVTIPLSAQSSDPVYAALTEAYAAQKAKQYDVAIRSFQQALTLAPDRASVHNDLAYLYLKVGETVMAREEFHASLQRAPEDLHIALEYAFLCYETKQQSEARRVFDRIRHEATGPEKETAEKAFQNIDRPLGQGIARWQAAVASDPKNYSGHRELAQLAEQREDLPLAATHYEAAFRLKPLDYELLLSLGRVWNALGKTDGVIASRARAALVAASRCPEPRTSEAARELLPERMPYASEFREALGFTPNSPDLHRELAYLLIAVNQKPQAEAEFHALLELDPKDLVSMAQLGLLRLGRMDPEGAMPLLKTVMESDNTELANRVRAALNVPPLMRRVSDPAPSEAQASTPNEARSDPKSLGLKSFEAGYLKDAIRYLQVAHESNPLDFEVMLKLGWAYNIDHQDEEAVKWFNLARHSPDPQQAAEAERAHHNLAADQARIRTTTWIMPIYSSRWKDLFAYGQTKADVRIGNLPFRPYLSLRFVGDTRGAIGATNPQYLSESSLIAGVGVASRPWRGVTTWAEAGWAMRYRGQSKDVGKFLPDYRGGVSYGKGFGTMLTGKGKGWFGETHEDGVFLSRFQKDTLFYTQTRAGYTLPGSEQRGIQAQAYWIANATVDLQHQAWANVFETGPGMRIKLPMKPAPMVFSLDLIRGSYLIHTGNSQPANFSDIRFGLWYAFTR